MARKFLTAIDLSKNELQNAAVQNLASAPATPVKGQLYFNSTGGDNTLYWYDGTTWVAAKSGGAISFGSVVPETTFGGSSADGIATTAARSDHKHANPLHDAAAHSTIPINSLAGATGPIDMNGFVIGEVGTPVQPGDAANKGYVDNSIAGLSWKDSVRIASTANLGLSGLAAVDGVTPIAGDRVLAKNQSVATENGIYIAATLTWVRATDADIGTELVSAAVYVEEGTTNADTAWVMTTNAPINVGVTAMAWAQFAGGGIVQAGQGLTQSGNTINVQGDATMVMSADAIARAAITGDVTIPAVSNAATIANDVVTNAKLANMANATIKGRASAGAGDPEDLNASQIALIVGGTLARKHIQMIGTGAATSFAITHNFNTLNVVVSVRRIAAPADFVEVDVEATNGNTTTVRFAVAPTTDEFMVTVLG